MQFLLMYILSWNYGYTFFFNRLYFYERMYIVQSLSSYTKILNIVLIIVTRVNMPLNCRDPIKLLFSYQFWTFLTFCFDEKNICQGRRYLDTKYIRMKQKVGELRERDMDLARSMEAKMHVFKDMFEELGIQDKLPEVRSKVRNCRGKILKFSRMEEVY